ncbi:MAG: N-acetyltransferase [Cyanobacteria bacterium]|nr:N-acetyltransferase [Cyanobacteriota bacterium]MDA1021327.1 N-acetyltransferase [Cyanobacteriota bacterium]
MQVQKLTTDYFNQVHDLIKTYSDRRLMLPLSLDELYHRAQAYRIIVDNDKVLACAHLDIFTPSLAEIKSLAVLEPEQGKGYGKTLVEDCEKEARIIGIKKLFVLTFQNEFFAKQGYHVVDRDTLPEKVYKECVKCAFYQDCKEIAMTKIL